MLPEGRVLLLLRFVAVAAVLMGASAAHAAGTNAATNKEEDDLIKQGVDARRKQDDAAALELFTKAYAIRQSPRAVAQMGLAEIALGRWVKAEAHLEEALAATGDPWIKKNGKVLSDSLARVRQEVGLLEVLGGPAGAEVVIAGEPQGTLPLAKPIHVRAAADVRFELRAPGHETAVRTVRVTGGQLTRETVTLEPLP